MNIELYKNQDIGELREGLDQIQENESNSVDEMPISCKSIGIGDGDVFESSEDSEEEKDQVLDLDPLPEPVNFIEEPKPKKYTIQQKNNIMEMNINAQLMTLFDVIGISSNTHFMFRRSIKGCRRNKVS